MFPCVEKVFVCIRQLGMSKARMMGQVQEITRAESPRCLAIGKNGKTRTPPPRVIFLPLADQWSFGLDH